MGKKLSEMTLEELWQLFPIFLTEHQDCWADWYAEEAALLRGLLGPVPVLSHIGSTAIKGIWAKPIVDILIEAPDRAALDAAKGALKAAGYICMADSGERADFNKGYTEEGFADRVFHLHLRLMGDNDELYFRDYMNAHPDAAKEYEALKLGLWKRYEHDRDEYTRQKTELVAKYTALAKETYAGRYLRPEILAAGSFSGEIRACLLRLLSFLRENGMEFIRGTGYWKDQYYWMVQCTQRHLGAIPSVSGCVPEFGEGPAKLPELCGISSGECVCFLLFNGTGEEAPTAPLTVWTDDSGSPWYEDGVLSQRERELAWKHVYICGHCGSCAGGTRKTVFGRVFENVCRTTMRFTAPDGEELALVEKLIELRKADIDRRK